MAIAEGRTIPFVGPEAVDVGVLETFEYAGPEQEILTETREFSPVCPYSGLPDFATLRIAYVPGSRCIELKSLKYYVTSYRSVGIFQEHATAKIAEDLFGVLRPRRLTVTTVYNTRGGFDTTCTVTPPPERAASARGPRDRRGPAVPGLGWRRCRCRAPAPPGCCRPRCGARRRR